MNSSTILHYSYERNSMSRFRIAVRYMTVEEPPQHMPLMTRKFDTVAHDLAIMIDATIQVKCFCLIPSCLYPLLIVQLVKQVSITHMRTCSI